MRVPPRAPVFFWGRFSRGVGRLTRSVLSLSRGGRDVACETGEKITPTDAPCPPEGAEGTPLTGLDWAVVNREATLNGVCHMSNSPRPFCPARFFCSQTSCSYPTMVDIGLHSGYYQFPPTPPLHISKVYNPIEVLTRKNGPNRSIADVIPSPPSTIGYIAKIDIT